MHFNQNQRITQITSSTLIVGVTLQSSNMWLEHKTSVGLNSGSPFRSKTV